MWTDRYNSVEAVALRVPMFGLPIYDNINGPEEPPEGWEPTEVTCYKCRRLTPYDKERVTPQGCYCAECFDKLPAMDNV